MYIKGNCFGKLAIVGGNVWELLESVGKGSKKQQNGLARGQWKCREFLESLFPPYDAFVCSCPRWPNISSNHCCLFQSSVSHQCFIPDPHCFCTEFQFCHAGDPGVLPLLLLLCLHRLGHFLLLRSVGILLMSRMRMTSKTEFWKVKNQWW